MFLNILEYVCSQRFANEIYHEEFCCPLKSSPLPKRHSRREGNLAATSATLWVARVDSADLAGLQVSLPSPPLRVLLPEALSQRG